MSAPKLISEREAVLRERTAFTKGSTFEMKAWQKMQGVDYCSGSDSIAEAQKRYPLPKIARPRVVSDDSVKWSGTLYWRAVDGVLEWRRTDGWQRIDSETSGMFINPARVRLLADLLANPNELVDDDGSASSSRPEGRASSEETT